MNIYLNRFAYEAYDDVFTRELEAYLRLLEVCNCPYFVGELSDCTSGYQARNVWEFIETWIKINSRRSFNPYMDQCARLILSVDNNSVNLFYTSTSSTSIVWCIELRSDFLTLRESTISVDVPTDRAKPGRCHYEALTAHLYQASTFPSNLPIPLWLQKELEAASN